MGPLRGPVVGFIEFVRERGIVGLALGFVLGGAVQKFVTSFVNDIITPAIGIISGKTENIAGITIGPFLVGDFFSSSVYFMFISALAYIAFRGLRLDRLDKMK